MSTYRTRNDPDGDDDRRDAPMSDAEWQAFVEAQAKLGVSIRWTPYREPSIYESMERSPPINEVVDIITGLPQVRGIRP